MKICVQGLGYVGASTSLLISNLKKKNKPIFFVYGLETNTKLGQNRVKSFKNYSFPFKSNDRQIPKILKEIQKNKNFQATTEKSSISKSDVIICSVNFDVKKNFKAFNDKTFKNAINDIANYVTENSLIIIQSTVPIGYTRKVTYSILEKKLKKRKININKIYLAHSYERVTPGINYVNSIANSHRVYSGMNEASKKKCKNFLKKIINFKKFPLTELENTDASELSKIMENSYRSTNIAFIEEWRRFSEMLGINLEKIIKAIRMRKTHSNIMMPGLGVGGYCLTKDPMFGELSSKLIFKKNLKFKFSNASVYQNKQILKNNIKKINVIIQNNELKKVNIIIFGMSYKEDVGDLRNSPSLILAKSLKSKGYNVSFYDNFIDEKIDKIKKLKKINDLRKFNFIIFTVKHKDIERISFKNIKIKKNTIIYDANLVLNNSQIKILENRTSNFYKVGIS